ncbi:MAG: hypothetical protein V4719_10210 [Planctomycetota bacterium]
MLSQLAEQELEAAVMEVMERHQIPGVVLRMHGGQQSGGNLRLTLGVKDFMPASVSLKVCPRCYHEEYEND